MAEEEVNEGAESTDVAETAEAAEGADGSNVDFPDLTDEAAASDGSLPAAVDEEGAGAVTDSEGRSASDLEAVFDVPVNISAVLGKTRLEVSSLLNLTRGAVIELDRKVGEAIDIYVNNRLIARGEVVLVEEKLGVTMTEIIQSDRQ